MKTTFTPNFDHIQNDGSITEPSVFARKMLIAFVKQYAEFKGVTQQEIAALTGFKQGNVSRILSAAYAPTLDNLLKIAAALDLHIDITEKKQ